MAARLDEFQRIERFFRPLAGPAGLELRDDAALLAVPPGQELVATVDAILDEGLVCHVGFVVDGQPFVIPTLHARDGDRVLIHGSAASRMLRTLSDGIRICLTVTLADQLVVARSVFHSSMNYRSVMLLGTARLIEEPAAKLAAMHALVEHLIPGRWDDSRRPNPKELKATWILEMPIDEASAK